MLIRRCILKYPRFFNLLIISVFYLTNVWSQATGDAHEDFLFGEYYVAQGLYQEALPFYFSSLEENPNNCNINYRIGLCYLKIIGEQHLALPYLEKAVEKVDIHYVEGKFKNPAAPVEAWLLLGDAYHRKNDLLKASFAYHQYEKLIGDSDHQAMQIVKGRIANLGISSEYQRFVQDVRMINLGGTINSRFSDYNPVLSGDQKTLIYTQFWESYDRIMITYRTPGGWTIPETLNDKIGSDGNCYTSALSFDGTELYLIWHDELDYEIYSTYYKDGVWSKIEPVPGKVNSRSRESSVGISADGNFLYFSSDRPGGEGGFDIYRAQRKGNEWTEVINIRNLINTAKNEEAPYITYDGNTLYFSSNGHETVGNMDILYSVLDSAGNWTLPLNIGLPVNTTNDDIFYSYYPDTRTGYLARNLAQGYGKNDLYRVQTGDDPQFTFDTLSFSSTDVETDNASGEGLNDSSAFASTNSEKTDSATLQTLNTLITESDKALPQEINSEITGNQITTVTSQVEFSQTGNNQDELLLKDEFIDPGSDEKEDTLIIKDQETSEIQHSKNGSGNNIDETIQSVLVTESSGSMEYNSGMDSDKSSSENDLAEDFVTSQSDQQFAFTAMNNSVNEDSLYNNREETSTGITTEMADTTDFQKYTTKDQEGPAVSGTDNTTNEKSPETQSKVMPQSEEYSENYVSGNQDTYAFTGNNKSSFDQSPNLSDYSDELVYDKVGQTESYSSVESGTFDTIQLISLENGSEYVSEYYLPPDSIPTYTIQIYALRHKIDPSRISLSPLIISDGNDGLFRYTYGKYIGYSKALEILFPIRESGFPDAFIRNISTVQNYAGHGSK